MLKNNELADAAITNIDGWDWSVHSFYEIDEQSGKALVEEYRNLKDELKDYKMRSAANSFLRKGCL